jgi:hypothetical protein
MSARGGGEPVIVWSRFNRGVAIAAWVFSAVIAISLLFTPDARYLTVLAVPVALSLLAWAIYWRPRVVVDGEAVELVNATRSVRIPWEAVTGVTTRFALTISTEKGRYPATGAPAPGAYGTYAANRELSRDVRERAVRPDSYRQSGELEGTDSGEASAVVLQHWDAWSRAGGRRGPAPAVVTWHPTAIGATTAATALAVLALITLP